MDSDLYFDKQINKSKVFAKFSFYHQLEQTTVDDCFELSVLNAIAAIIACIFIIGLVNNVFACIVIVSSRSMHTATNCYLFSLSMSDILLLVTGTTQEMYNIYNPNQLSFGIIGCSIKNWAAEMSVNVSVLTIAAFTVERYLAICYPFYAQVTSQFSRAIKVLVAIWLIAALCALVPASQTRLYYGDFNDCYLDQKFLPYYLEISSIVFFIVPMILMTIMYIQIGLCLRRSTMLKNTNNPNNCRESHSANSRNILKMFVLIVATFFICWIPFHVQRLMASHIMIFVDNPGTSYDVIMCILKHGSIISYQLSAVIDPIIYSIMSVKFRKASKNLLLKYCGRCLGSDVIREASSFKTNTTKFSQYNNHK